MYYWPSVTLTGEIWSRFITLRFCYLLFTGDPIFILTYLIIFEIPLEFEFAYEIIPLFLTPYGFGEIYFKLIYCKFYFEFGF